MIAKKGCCKIVIKWGIAGRHRNKLDKTATHRCFPASRYPKYDFPRYMPIWANAHEAGGMWLMFYIIPSSAMLR